MACKSTFATRDTQFSDCHLESVARWLSCNGEVSGVGPTLVFASAAALFLYHELHATQVFLPADRDRVSVLEKTLVVTMVAGMLALMVHVWVCSMRFFQYYLHALIKDSPSFLLEMTTVSFLGGAKPIPALGPLTLFLHQQQPQIHITICWFLSLCYADYVRKHYCQRFNLPYLEQWQTELQERASHGVTSTIEKVNSFVGSVQQRLRAYTAPATPAAAAAPDTATARNAERKSVSYSELCIRREPGRAARAGGGAGAGNGCGSCETAGQECLDGGRRCGPGGGGGGSGTGTCKSCEVAGQGCVDGGRRCGSGGSAVNPVLNSVTGVDLVGAGGFGSQRTARDKVIEELRAYCEATRCECREAGNTSQSEPPQGTT